MRKTHMADGPLQGIAGIFPQMKDIRPHTGGMNVTTNMTGDLSYAGDTILLRLGGGTSMDVSAHLQRGGGTTEVDIVLPLRNLGMRGIDLRRILTGIPEGLRIQDLRKILSKIL